MFLESFGRRLRERREALQLTQLDVANALRVSPQAVSKWERGENAPDLVLLSAVSDILDTSADWLIGRHAPQGGEFEATVFVSSVQGYTARCEGMPASDVTVWINGVFRQVTEAVLREGGIPVKYLGDGFLAFFAGDRHRARGLSAAMSARNVVADPLVVGLASGSAHLAALGHGPYARPDITGFAVNTAFRVNGWAATNAKSLVAAAMPWDEALASQHRGTVHSGVALKGLSLPMQIVELIGPA